VICILPAILIVGFYLNNQVKSQLLSQIDASLNSNLHSAKAQIERELFHMKNAAVVIANDLEIKKSLDRGISMGVNAQLNRIARAYPELNYLFLLDDIRSIFAITTLDTNVASSDLLGESALKLTLASNISDTEATFSAPVIDPYAKIFAIQDKYSQWIYAPVIIRGKAKGWVVLSFKFQYSIAQMQSDLIARLRTEGYPALYSYISNGNKQIVAGEDKKQLNTLSQQLEFDIAGESFFLNLYFNKTIALQLLRDTNNILLVSFLSLLVVLLLGLYWSIRNVILLPIKELEEGAHQFSSGKLNFRLQETGEDEIAQLAKSFNSMGRKISDSKQYLESEVVRRTQQAEESSTRLEAILDTAADAIITIDDNGLILTVNKAAEELFGYPSSEMVGRDVKILMHKDLALKHGDYISNYLTSDVSKIIGVGRELEGLKKDGSIFSIFLSVSEVNTANGKIFTGIIRDITLSKQVEKSLIEAKVAAEESARFKSEFLASMSHEIRTPMNGVLGMLGLLLNSALTTEQRHKANLAKSSAKSLLNLINDILDFSKVEAGKLDLEILDFNLRGILGEFAESMAFLAQQKGLEVILDVTQVEQSTVRGDPGRLRQILTNLVGNAIKFTHQGEIVIRTSLIPAVDSGVMFNCSITDSGIGIPENKLETLFDVFTQVDASTTRQYGGTGLGLSICKKLCELMGGSIKVRSEVGMGSCFEFNVLLHASEISQQVLPSVDIGTLELLIIDDNATNREVLRGQLEHWGAKVVESESAELALSLCNRRLQDKSKIFDVAFLDMQMPEMDGAQLAREIKSISGLDTMKLVMMTSISHRNDAQYFADLGFNAFFPKPATTSDLFDALSVVIDDGEALKQASPLVTHNYLKTLVRKTKDESGINPVTELLRRNCRILLVEDNQVNQQVAVGILNEFGLNADIAANGYEAIESLKLTSQGYLYDLVLMDCQMPEMDGYEATRKIRADFANETNTDVIIIAMTANAMEGDREKCLEAGMNDYLAKPIDPELLLGQLLKWIPSENEQTQINNTQNGKQAVIIQAGTKKQTIYSQKDEQLINDKELIIWDKVAVLKRVMGKEKLLLSLIASFNKEMPVSLKQITEMKGDFDFKQLRGLAHTIKGVSANLSCLELQKTSALLEQKAMAEEQQECELLVASVLKAFDKATFELESYLDENS